MKAIEQGYTPSVLLNVMNENGKISRSHGIPASILEAQAKAAQLPIHLISSSWQEYELHFTAALKELKETYSVSHAVFGDIDLQPHRDWEEMVCNKVGLTAYLPLWQQDRRSLVMQMLNSGIRTMIVSCNEVMGVSFIGKTLTPSLIDELEVLGVDVCGENGEFHTLVYDCPLFHKPLQIEVKQALQHDQYYFSELILLK
jgi:diphthine-ammonia ligase